MIRFLVIGDFNSVLRKSLIKKVEREKFDAVLALGDYGGDKRIGRITFKNWGKNWEDVVGEKRAKQLLKEDYDKSLKILKWLNSLRKSVFFIFGNNDQYKGNKVKSFEGKNLLKYTKKFKNFKYVHEKTVNFKGTKIYGHGGFVTSDIYLNKKYAPYDKKKMLKRIREYNKDKKVLLKNKKIDIFLIHYPLYGIFDKINNPVVKKMHGKKIGFKPYNLAVKKFKPKIVFCSHMEEHSSEKKKYRNSLVVNPGSALFGRYCFLDFDENKKIVKNVKFCK